MAATLVGVVFLAAVLPFFVTVVFLAAVLADFFTAFFAGFAAVVLFVFFLAGFPDGRLFMVGSSTAVGLGFHFPWKNSIPSLSGALY